MRADVRHTCLLKASAAHVDPLLDRTRGLNQRRGRRWAQAPYRLVSVAQGRNRMLGGDNRASKRSKVKLFTVEAAGIKGSGLFCGQQAMVLGLVLFRFHLAFPTAVAMGGRTPSYSLERREALGCYYCSPSGVFPALMIRQQL